MNMCCVLFHIPPNTVHTLIQNFKFQMYGETSGRRVERGNGLYRIAQGVEYLVSRLCQSTEQVVTDKLLKDLLVLRGVLGENKEAIETEEYHKLTIEIDKHREEVKGSKEYSLIRSKKQGEIVVEETVEGRICLITQKEIEEKIEAPCGHVFDRKGIIYLYKNAKPRKKFQCPYVGCKSDWYKIKYKPV